VHQYDRDTKLAIFFQKKYHDFQETFFKDEPTEPWTSLDKYPKLKEIEFKDQND
jgi:hypothetical protein